MAISAPSSDRCKQVELASLTDSDLVECIADDDEEAFAALITRYATRVGSLVRRILGAIGTYQDVEEVVSDTFLTLWRKSSEYDPSRASVWTWLSWLVVAQALPRRRKLLRHQQVQTAAKLAEEANDVFPGVTVNGGSIDDGTMARLQAALSSLAILSPSDTDIVARRYLSQQTTKEISEALGITEGNARVRLYRALRRLRSLYESAV